MRYDVRAVVRWKVRSNLDKQALEREALESLLQALSKSDIPRFDIKVFAVGSREEARVISELCWKKSVEKIYESKNSLVVRDGGKRRRAKMNPQRFFLFRENNRCVCCGAIGGKLLVEMNDSDKSPHLNLYAKSGKDLVLMTRDHIQPKSLGGGDHISNYQTMCSVCNSLKGHSNIRLSDLSRLRSFYDQHRGKSKRELHFAVERERARLCRPWKFGPHQSKKCLSSIETPTSRTITDLAVYRLPDGSLAARSICEKPIQKTIYVGNIRRGMTFRNLFTYKREVECQVGGCAVTIPNNLVRGDHARKWQEHGDGDHKAKRNVSASDGDASANADGSSGDVRLQKSRKGSRLVRKQIQNRKSPRRGRKRAGKPSRKARDARERNKKKLNKNKGPGDSKQ